MALAGLAALLAGPALAAPAAHAAVFPGYTIAFESPTNPINSPGDHSLMLYNPGGSVSFVNDPVNDTVSPALARQANGSPIGAFVGLDGRLWWYTSPALSDQHAATAPPSAPNDGCAPYLCVSAGPAVAAGNGGGWRIAVNRAIVSGTLGSTRLLFVDSSSPDNPIDTGQVVKNHAAPAIASLSTGGYEAAFLNADGQLRVIGPDNQVRIGDAPGGAGLVPAPNTNPVIAADNNGGWVIAAHGANNNNLWTLDSSGHVQQTAAVLAPNTSPAIVGLAHGGYAIAYVNSDGTLWRDINGVLAPAGPFQAVPAPGTSPSIAADNNGGWEIAVQGANNHYVWTLDSAGNMNSTQQTMFAGTEAPAIAGIPAPDPAGGGGGTPPPPQTIQVGLTRQVPTSGPIWYQGQFPPFGSTQPGHLVQIQLTNGLLNPVTALLFVKVGHSTTECNSNPNATVQLNAGQTTTPAQIAAIYGTTQPTFDTLHPLPFVACYVGSASPSTLSIQATFQFNQ
ncbi:MAG TPA: hypothetical protein VJT31_26610 [Rugosimonospora sp.]|nr:hypothetical protein [Rugosimonospora sp.]